MKNKTEQIKKIETKFLTTKDKNIYSVMTEPQNISEYVDVIVKYSDSDILNKLSLELADLILSDKNVYKKHSLLAQIAKRSTSINACISNLKDSQLHFYEALLSVCFQFIFLNSNKSDLYKFLNTVKSPVVKPMKELATTIRDLLDAINEDNIRDIDEEIIYQGFSVEEIATEIIADQTNYKKDTYDYTGDAEGGFDCVCSNEGEDNWCAWFWATSFLDSFIPKGK